MSLQRAMHACDVLDADSVKRESSDVSKADSSPHSSQSTHRSLATTVNSSSPFMRNGSSVSPSFSGGSSPDSDSSPSPPSSHQSLDTASPPPASALTHSHSLTTSPPTPTPAQSQAAPDDAESGISGFIRKTFNMVGDASTADIVSWDDAGDSFIVKREFEFASLVLPRYFRHKNFSSFVRQLNFYGFNKRSHQSKYTKFQHPHFKRGQPQNLSLIKRKSAESTANYKDNIAQLAAQVTDLKRQYDDLYRIQQQILYIFARYLKAYPLSPQVDGNQALTGTVQQPSQAAVVAGPGEERERAGGKRQRLLGDGSAHPAYSRVEPLPAPSVGVATGSALMQVPLSSSASTLAALLSSPSPANLPSSQPAAPPSTLSAREAEIVELNALQAVMAQQPAAGQPPFGLMDPTTAAAITAALANYQTQAQARGTAGIAPPIASTQPVAAAPAAVGGSHDANSTLAALAAPGGPLSHLSPLMLSALTALGNTGAAAPAAPLQQPPHMHQAPLGPHANPVASVQQLSGLSSLSALPPLSSLSSAAAPLSAQDLLQLLQHAHPDNRASRLSAIRNEQRMLEDEDEQEEDMDDEDDHHYDGERHYAHNQPAAPSDWLPSTAAAMLPGTAAALDGGYHGTMSPRRSNAAVVESKLPASSSFLPGTSGALFDQYRAAGLMPGNAPFKTREIGSLYSNADDPYLSSLHSQLAAASSSQNAASSVSMSSSIVSPATPLHLQPSSSVSHDGGVVLTPQLHATLSQLLSHSHALPSNGEVNTLPHYSNAGFTHGHLNDHFAHAMQADGASDGSAALPNLALVNQLQAIANVSRHLQNMYHPNVASALHPSTVSPAFAQPRSQQQQQHVSQQPHHQQLRQASPAYSALSGHGSHSQAYDDKLYSANAHAAQQPFYPSAQPQPSMHPHHAASSVYAASPSPYSHPYAGDALSAVTDASYRHHSSMPLQRVSGHGSSGRVHGQLQS